MNSNNGNTENNSMTATDIRCSRGRVWLGDQTICNYQTKAVDVDWPEKDMHGMMYRYTIVLKGKNFVGSTFGHLANLKAYMKNALKVGLLNGHVAYNNLQDVQADAELYKRLVKVDGELKRIVYIGDKMMQVEAEGEGIKTVRYDHALQAAQWPDGSTFGKFQTLSVKDLRWTND